MLKYRALPSNTAFFLQLQEIIFVFRLQFCFAFWRKLRNIRKGCSNFENHGTLVLLSWFFFTLKRDHKDLKIWSSCNCDEPYASNVIRGGHRLRKSKNMTVNKIKLNYLRALVNENPLTFILSLQQQRPCK